MIFSLVLHLWLIKHTLRTWQYLYQESFVIRLINKLFWQRHFHWYELKYECNIALYNVPNFRKKVNFTLLSLLTAEAIQSSLTVYAVLAIVLPFLSSTFENLLKGLCPRKYNKCSTINCLIEMLMQVQVC